MKERGALQQYWDAAPELAKRLGDAEDAAKAELEAMRKDAERYRWLRSDAVPTDGDCPAVYMMDGGGILVGELLDAEVDAAMTACGDEK